ncbi:MAG: hypothetical protein HYZ63_01255 [Candidatus Andersenbacteria bacterium]|nr:hypothetical protein [Candidatus Andersenbacteria bacterium]
MLSLTHTIISLPFGIYMDNPWLIVAATVAFHFFADTLLHWNIYPWKFKSYPYALVALDIASGLAMAWLLTGDRFPTIPIWAAIIGGNLPDIVQALWDFLNKKIKDTYFAAIKPLFIWHDKLQLETSSPILGLLSQGILIAIALLLI